MPVEGTEGMYRVVFVGFLGKFGLHVGVVLL